MAEFKLAELPVDAPPLPVVCSERLLPALQEATPAHSHIARCDHICTKDICLLEVDEEQLQEVFTDRCVL